MSAIRFGAAAKADYFGERFGFADLFFEVGWSDMAMSYITSYRLRGDECAGACSARARTSIRTVLRRILAQDRVDQILHCVGFRHHLIRQPHATSVAEPQHELDALEAAEPQLAFEMRSGAARAKLFQSAQTAELDKQLPDGAKRLRLDDGLAIELYFGSAHSNGQGEVSPGVRITNTPPMSRAYHPATGGSSSGTDRWSVDCCTAGLRPAFLNLVLRLRLQTQSQRRRPEASGTKIPTSQSAISDESYLGLVAKDFEKSHGNNFGSS